MKVLVTGGTGFLGSHFVERLLARGDKVLALARKTSDITHLKTTGAQIIIGDVEDYDSLLPAVKGVNIVYHAAARVTPGWGTWKLFESSIIKGTDNMLSASVAAGVTRFLHVSTGTVNGKLCEGDTPACESTPYDVAFSRDAYYDFAKKQAEEVATRYHKEGKIQVSMIRVGAVYGPRDRLLADRVYRHVSLPVIVWPGKSNPKYSIVYASDVADFAILVATSQRAIGEIYNVAPMYEVPLRQFTTAMIKAVGGPKLEITMPYSVAYIWCTLMEEWAKLRRVEEMPYLTRSSLKFVNRGVYLDGSKARDELGWQPRISIEEGTKLYVQWRRSQKRG